MTNHTDTNTDITCTDRPERGLVYGLIFTLGIWTSVFGAFGVYFN